MPNKRTKRLTPLEAQVDGKVCTICDQEPQVVWLGGLTGEQKDGLRCACWPKAPVLRKHGGSREAIAKREATMIAANRVQWPDTTEADRRDLFGH